MHTTERFGGVTLGAFADGRLVGYSYALPGFDRAPFLLSCGLAVADGFESGGIGAELKRAQARRARDAGYDTVRWTTNSLASRPLRLYLSKLGARLVGYHAQMYAALRDDVFPDEVEIEWDLRGTSPPGDASPVPLTRTEPAGPGIRRLTAVEPGMLDEVSYSVEIPWDRGLVERHRPDLAEGWLAGIRRAMPWLLARGYVGTAVAVDGPARRSFVRFDRT
jgi:predicted GNAT superfamily acetyltransferase